MKIPFVDVTSHVTNEKKEILHAITDVVNKGDFILGRAVAIFEKNFARYIGSKYCVSVASGTDAILLSLKALNIKENDEVIIPAMSFVASIVPVIQLGAKPVLVDILPDYPLMDVSKIEKVITKKTKVILPVHMHGYPVAMEQLSKIARKYNIVVLEDACQAHGSVYKKKKAGALGDIAAFSFYPSKNIGAYGDGGAITTSNDEVYKALLLLRDHGDNKNNKHTLLGYNSRLDSIQAAVVNIKLRSINKHKKTKLEKKILYDNYLRNLPVMLPKIPPDIDPCIHVYSIRVANRDKLFDFLNSKGIQCRRHYALPLHLQPSLSFLRYKKGDFPNAEAFANENISLPFFPHITENQIKYVCNAIKQFLL